MLNCYIVDDESHGVKVLQEFIKITPGLNLSGSTQDPLEAVEFITTHAIDISFIDMEMPVLSGLELAGLINEYTSVIFTTGFLDFAIEAFEKGAFDYILKPVPYERFLKSIRRYEKQREALIKTYRNEEFFFIKSEGKGKLTRINIKDIKYIEGSLNYVMIYSNDGKYTTYLTLNEVISFLPENKFSRIHKSFIVNNDRIKSIEATQVILDDKTCLTLGSTYRQRVFEKISENVLKSNRKV